MNNETGSAGITPENSAPDGTDRAPSKKILRSSNTLANRRRTQPEISFSFTREMAENAEQEYFFLSFGKIGAGKTTLHYHLLRYFEQRPDFDGQEVVDDTLPDGQRAAQAQLINNWRSRWAEGVFPESTPKADEVRAIRYSIRPTIGNGKRINITFLEVAGELLTEIVNNDPHQRHQFPPALEALFANNGVKLIIAFVISPTALENETDDKNIEMLFPAFLNYLRGKFPERARTPLMVVLNNPHDALRIARDPAFGVDMKGETEWTPDLLQRFLDEIMPAFMQNFRRWSADRKNKMVTLFSVGRVRSENIEGEETFVIETPANFRHAAAVAKFIYETFTGTRIRHSLLTRLLMWMKVKS